MATGKARVGFTLIELLVVIAIISLLVSILLPSLRQAKEMAIIAVCASNQHHICLALHSYASENDGRLPPSTFRDWGGQHNYVRIPPFEGLLKGHGSVELWFCPSIVSAHREEIEPFYPHVKDHSASLGDYEDDLGRYSITMIGYAYCAGLVPGHQSIGSTFEEIQSPHTLEDRPDWTLCADYMEVWWDPGQGQTHDSYDCIQVNHAEPCGGLIRGTRGWLVPTVPAGSNVGYLDGHVEWRDWSQLVPRQRAHPWYPMGTHFW